MYSVFSYYKNMNIHESNSCFSLRNAKQLFTNYSQVIRYTHQLNTFEVLFRKVMFKIHFSGTKILKF